MSELGKCYYVESQFVPTGQNMKTEILVHFINPDKYIDDFEIKIFAWTKISEVKKIITDLKEFTQGLSSKFKLFYKNIELSQSSKTLFDYGVETGSTILIKINQYFKESKTGFINEYHSIGQSNLFVQEMIEKTKSALNAGNIPMLVGQGTSGSYFIENEGQIKISIFKPYDEEVNAPNNPRGYEGMLGSDGICRGILSGECATREVATYQLDANSQNYHNVPTTTYIQLYHPSFESLNISTKHGSLQQFIPNSGIIGDFGSGRFSVEEVHKIAILDLRILNCDRNDGNVLVHENDQRLQLIPIDHGLSFPDNLQIYEESIIWMSFKQAKAPFTDKELKFLQSIEPIQDSKMLADKLGFRQICLRNFRLAQIFLKKTAAFGCTLYEIGKMIYREGDPYDEEENKRKNRSKFQELVRQTQNLYFNMLEHQKENNPIIFQSDDEQDECEGSLETNQSLRNIALRKKISLPVLKKRTTSFYQQRNNERKKKEGVNGIKKSVWNKYETQEWTQLFYHYFENFVETYLNQKCQNREQKGIKKTLP